MITEFTFWRRADPNRSNDWVPGYKAHCFWREDGKVFEDDLDRHELEELLSHFAVTGVSYSFTLYDHWTNEVIVKDEQVVADDLSYVGPHDPVWVLDHPAIDEVAGVYFNHEDALHALVREMRKGITEGLSVVLLNSFRLTHTTPEELEVPHLVRLLGRQSVIDYLNDF